MKGHWLAHALPEGKIWDKVYYFIIDVKYAVRIWCSNVWFFLNRYW